MAKIISFGLVFALLGVVSLHSVLCQDDAWDSMIDEVKSEAEKVGVSQDTINEAQKIIGDGTAQKLAEDALGVGSLDDWVQAEGGSPAEAPQDLPDDEEEDNLPEEPESSTKSSTFEAPEGAPTDAPSEAPFEEFQSTTSFASMF
ncbi:hypothetical protein VNO78_28696 [Psophocarpus tetragonolobus]|uniref:Uncharacterized protein n=1 Tax=Psophocarpus tetragonolobus TaxID=3891 RepID=A0AAN9RTQ3_PSOTE